MRPIVSKLALVTVAVCLASLTPFSPAVAGAGRPGDAAGHAAAPSREHALRQTMRKLWEDHVTWTRLVIVSAAANHPDLDATTRRLLKNQVDIGDAIKPFYGEASGNSLAALLRDHILGAAEILAAAKANDPARLEAAKQAWYANGDEIARSAGAGPHGVARDASDAVGDGADGASGGARVVHARRLAAIRPSRRARR